jgi:hypothetical protein
VGSVTSTAGVETAVFPNGVRIVTEPMPHVRSVSVGVWIRSGSRLETPAENGVSHFIEHMLFKGTKRRSARQIAKEIEQEYISSDQKYLDLLKNISSSWKNFKKSYDECLNSLAQNTIKTKRLLQLITAGLLINTARLFIEDYYFFGWEAHFLYTTARELSSYVLVVLSFFLLRNQTQKFLTLKGEVVKMDREILFFPNNLEDQEEHEGLYNEFDPLEVRKGGDGKEDQNPSE